MKYSVRSLLVYILAALIWQELSANECTSTCGPRKTCNNNTLKNYRGPRTYYRARSVNDNTARRLVGWQDLINCYNINSAFKINTGVMGAFATTFEYQRSFRSSEIARYFFGSDKLSFKGSQVPGRNNSCDIVADYFGLPVDFVGKLRVEPVIDNFILDNQMYLALDSFVPGLFFRAEVPIVHSRWNLGLIDCSENLNNPPTIFPPGYMGIIPANTTDNKGAELDLLTTGIKPLKSLREGLSGETFGEMSTPWRFGKFPWCRQDLTRIADINLMLGFDIFNSPFNRFGFYALGVMPTGNRPDPRYLFSPVIGTGHFWQLGIGITGFASLMECGEYSAAIYYEGNVTHLFKNNQVRLFDFCPNGPLSRYLLLKQIGKPVLLNNNVGDIVIEDKSPADAISQDLYAGNLINAVNYTTRIAEVSVPVKGDFSIKIALDAGPYSFDIGYNIYGNSREKVCIKCQPPCRIDERKHAIKGTTGTHFFEVCDGTEYNTAVPTTLNASQSTATLYNGTINPAAVDNPVQLVASGNTAIPIVGTQAVVTLGQVTNNIVNLDPCSPTVSRLGINWDSGLGPTDTVSLTALEQENLIAYISNPPVFTLVENLNIASGTAPSQITHKVFGHVNYVWRNSRFTPFIGMGAEAEFAARKCNNAGLNQWGILLKGGITF